MTCNRTPAIAQSRQLRQDAGHSTFAIVAALAKSAALRTKRIDRKVKGLACPNHKPGYEKAGAQMLMNSIGTTVLRSGRTVLDACAAEEGPVTSELDVGFDRDHPRRP